MPEHCPGCGALKCICCPECDGTGSVPSEEWDDWRGPVAEECDACDGTGLDSSVPDVLPVPVAG